MDFDSKAWHTEALYKTPDPDTPEHGLSRLVVDRISQLLGPIADKESTLRDIVNVAIWDAQELIVNRIPLNRSMRSATQPRRKEGATVPDLDGEKFTRSPNIGNK